MTPLPVPPSGARLEVRVDGLDDEGRGRATLDDKDIDVAVRGAFPGDLVRCEVERAFVTRRLVQARLLTLLEEGPARVERTCPHRAPCAGCPLEGAEPGLILELKAGRVRAALDEVGIVAPIDDVEPSRAPRQKVKLAVGGRRGALAFGLYAPRSHRVVRAELCPHTHPSLASAAIAIRTVLEQDGQAVEPAQMRALVMRATRDGVGAVLVVNEPLPDAGWDGLAALVEGGGLACVSERVTPDAGNSVIAGEVTRHVGPLGLTPFEGGPAVSVDAFCQPDPALSSWMVRETAAFLTAGGTDGWFVDAYAGAGPFAGGLLRAGARHVVAIERAPWCKQALDERGAEAWVKTVADACTELNARALPPGAPPLGIVADPPRKGLADDAGPLIGLGAERFALVSCDPDAMARDLRTLTDAGYTIVRIAPLDLFVATPNVEVLTFLLRTVR